MAMRWHKAPNKLRDRRFLSLTPSARGVLACLEELLAADPELSGNITQVAGWIVTDRKVTREALDAIGASGYLEITLEDQGKAGAFYTIRYPTVPQACPDRAPSVPQASPKRHPDKSGIDAGLRDFSLKRVEENRVDKNPLTPKGDLVAPEIPSEEVPFSEPLLDEPDPEEIPEDDAPTWKKDAAFLAFWHAYIGPRKKSAAKAFERWRRLKLTAKNLPALLAALEEDKASKDWTKDGGDYIPAPEVWLNRKRWLDDLGDDSPAGSNVVPIRPSLAVPDEYAGRPWSHLWTPEMRGTLSEAQHIEYLAGRTAHFYKTLDEREATALYQAEGLEAAMALIWSHNPLGRMANA